MKSRVFVTCISSGWMKTAGTAGVVVMYESLEQIQIVVLDADLRMRVLQ